MAYIDKDAIPYFIAIDKETGKKVFIVTKEYVDKVPAADVVPRAEVERLQAELDDKQFRCDSCDRIMLTGAEHRACVKQAKAEVTSKIFADLDSMMLDGAIGGKYPAKVINPDKYAELKKKYLEEKHDAC